MTAADASRWLDILLLGGGWIVAFAEVYMDESYVGKADAEHLHVVGYLFRKQGARLFTQEWGRTLKRVGLPYFHMAECAHGTGVFKDMDKSDRIALQTRLIALTHQHTVFGFGVTVNQPAYREIIHGAEGMPESPYAFAAFSALMRIRKWCNQTAFTGSISFMFEAGHEDSGKADDFLKWFFDIDVIAAKNRYGGHAFLPKSTPCLHPADMLAWQWNAEVARRHDPKRRPQRKDFLALVRPQDAVVEYDRKKLLELRAVLDIRKEFRDAAIADFLTGRAPLPALHDQGGD